LPSQITATSGHFRHLTFLIDSHPRINRVIGYGEQFLRTVLAKTISDFVQFKDLDAAAAAQAGIDYLVRKVNGDGGVIVIDAMGRCASAQSTSGLIRGWIEQGGEAHCKLG
jgi:L-asparaginase / beta-aspartyl-peptidase